MEINLCMKCMEHIASYPCPHCGCPAEEARNKDFALPCETILQGRYLVGKVLGRGGFGVTYIGYDLALETKVAIKEYYPSGQVTRNMAMGLSLIWTEGYQGQDLRHEGMDTFLREARKMAKVDDIPEVVRVRDTFYENETAYIVMDYVDGETLLSRLQRTGPMTWDQAREIFMSAAETMEQVHQAGLVHRDLSPDNLMLDARGRVRILDLGAAKDLKTSSGVSSMLVAKGGFSPLEQYTQRGGSGPWTDVYALAATLYYTITGTIPPAAIDRMEEDTLRWDLPSLMALPGTVRTALENAMQVTAKTRTQSMAEFRRQLTKSQAAPQKPKEKPEKPAPEEPKKEPKKTGGSTKKPLLAALAAVCAIAVGAALLGGGKNADDGAALRGPDSQEQIAELPTDVAVETTEQAVPQMMPPVDPDAKRIEPILGTISAGFSCSAGIQEDGTIVYAGDFSDAHVVDSFQNVKQIEWGTIELFALREDGSLFSAWMWGDEMARWTNLTQIAANGNGLIALKADGTVYSEYEDDERENVSHWRDIKAIEMGRYSFGIKKDGTVVAAGDNPPDVSGWTEIVQVSNGGDVVAGLRSDGTVVLAFEGELYHQPDGKVFLDNNTLQERSLVEAELWTDIVAISVADIPTHIVGLRADGTVVAVGDNEYGECDVSDWTDIVAISSGCNYTIGLKSDGTMVSAGDNEYGRCDVSGWRNIRTKN